MHVVEVGVEPHRLPGRRYTRRFDPRANLGPLNAEEHHRLHTHRLNYVEGDRKLTARIDSPAAQLGDVFGP